MKLRISITAIRLILLVIFMEFMTAPFVPAEKRGAYPITLQQKHHNLSNLLFSSALVEKTEKGEKGEKGEKESRKYAHLELADFPAIIICLVHIHAPATAYLSATLFLGRTPPLFKLFRTFLI